MTRASCGRKVLLVNSIGMRMPLPGKSTMPWRRVWRKFKSMLRHVRRPLADHPDYVVMTAVLWPFYGSPRGRAINAALTVAPSVPPMTATSYAASVLIAAK